MCVCKKTDRAFWSESQIFFRLTDRWEYVIECHISFILLRVFGVLCYILSVSVIVEQTQVIDRMNRAIMIRFVPHICNMTALQTLLFQLTPLFRKKAATMIIKIFQFWCQTLNSWIAVIAHFFTLFFQLNGIIGSFVSVWTRQSMLLAHVQFIQLSLSNQSNMNSCCWTSAFSVYYMRLRTLFLMSFVIELKCW